MIELTDIQTAVAKILMNNNYVVVASEVKDRFLSVNEVIFDIDKSALITYFELEFYQETKAEAKELPKMENLIESVVTKNSGTSEDIN